MCDPRSVHRRIRHQLTLALMLLREPQEWHPVGLLEGPESLAGGKSEMNYQSDIQ